ncbi:NAD+ synthase [Leisingera caerulea]|uniref:NAD+ synthase n=1 Tax=Leisingera caerulea TaxID=506591 RepID=UPI000418FA3D|nr:NAD+ synthase [Leisingera caerulea]
MTQDTLHIALIQDNPIVGDVEGNARLALKHLEENGDADLVVFSECFVSGYPVGDLVLRPGFIASVEEQIGRIRAEVIAKNGPSVLIGAPAAGTGLPYNAAFLIEPSGAMRIVRKRELPTNDVFDERRTFAGAEGNPSPLSFRGFSLGVQICEDMWHGQVSRALADELADVLLVLNGSPYQRGKQEVRLRHAAARVRATGLPLLYVNQVSGQDELVFDGGTFSMNTDGAVAGGCAFTPTVMKVVLRREQDGSVRVGLDAEPEGPRHPEDPIAADYNACVLGLRDYVGKTGMPRVFIGVSGGLDSALVLAMAVDAIGADRVIGVMMPSRHTSQASLDLADDLMRRTGVIRECISIDEGFEVVDAAMTSAASRLAGVLGIEPDHGIGRENDQSRLRGLKLMDLTNRLGGIVISTGNKSELAVGYCTLYGDTNGGFNPLKSVYKSDAFAMARWRNEAEAVLDVENPVAHPIPDEIIARPPSAELAEGQTDQQSLGDYDLLDCVLRQLVEVRAGAAAAARELERQFGAEDVWKRSGGYSALSYAERIAGLLRRAQYKRDQTCPGVKLNEVDFGLGLRLPIAGSYKL